MKEIIAKVAVCIVAVVLVIGIAFFALKGDDTPDVEQGSSGTSTSETAGQEKTTSSQSGNSVDVDATTGNSGNQTTPSQQSQGSVDSQGSTNSPSVSDTQDPQNQQTSTSSANAPSQQDNPQNVQQSQPQQNGDTTQNNATPGVPVPPQQTENTNKIDKYQNIFKGGKFVMKVNDPDLGPVTMAMNDNKMFVEASMEGITLKMLYDGDKPDKKNPETGTWYIVIDQIKKYSPMPADMVGDMNVEELTKDFAKGDGNTVYTTSYENVNGEKLECESCVDSNGNTTKYYFRGDQLVRSDSISPDGSVSTTEFQEISTNVDNSLFAIPEGYAKWDISWLINMVA